MPDPGAKDPKVRKVFAVVAERVRALRDKADWTQEETAQRAGIGLRQYARVEAGETVKLHTLLFVARALKTSVSKLLEGL